MANNLSSIESFLRTFISSGNTGNSPSDAVEYYANTVQPYFGKRRVSARDILHDKQGYYRKWPNRNYRLTRFAITNRYEQKGLYYFEVIFEINWRVSSPRKGARNGHSTVYATLVKQGGRYKIVAIHSRITKL